MAAVTHRCNRGRSMLLVHDNGLGQQRYSRLLCVVAALCLSLGGAPTALALPLTVPRNITLGIIALLDTNETVGSPTYEPDPNDAGARADMEEAAATKLAVVALQQKHPQILGNYSIHLDFRNSLFSEVVSTAATIEVLDPLRTSNPARVIIGFYNELPAQASCLAASYFGVPVMSDFVSSVTMTSTDESIDGSRRFPTFSRVIPSDEVEAAAIVSLIKQIGWQRFTIVRGDTRKAVLLGARLEEFASVHNLQTTSFTTRGGASFTRSVSADSLADALRRVRQLQDRVIVLALSNFDMPIFLDVASSLGMLGDEYVYIGTRQVLWDASLIAQRGADMKGMIGPTFFVRNDRFNNFSQFWASHVALDPVKYFNIKEPVYSALRYDAVLVVAHALSQLIAFDHFCNASTSRNAGTRLDTGNLSFTTRNWTCGDLQSRYNSGLLLSNIIRGSHAPHTISDVRFFENGDGNVPLPIANVRNSELVYVGTFNVSNPRDSVNGTLTLQRDLIRFRDGTTTAPRDRPEVHDNPVLADRSVVVAITVLSCVVIVYALAMIAFNVYNRAVPFVRISSPVLNVVILCSCVLGASASLLESTLQLQTMSSERYTRICVAEFWIFPIASTMLFGTLLAKTWRVYLLFAKMQKNLSMRKGYLRDQDLLAAVAVLVAVDVFFLSVWMGVDPMRREELRSNLRVDPEMPSRNIEDVSYFCTSDHMASWVATLSVIQFVLLFLAFAFAFKTRHIKIKAVNESRHVSFALYICVILGSVGLAALVIIDDVGTPHFLIRTLVGLLIVLSVVTMLFLPKVRTLMYGQRAESTGGASGGSRGHVLWQESLDPSEDLRFVAKLTHENQQKTRRVSTLEVQLQEANARIRKLSERSGHTASGTASGSTDKAGSSSTSFDNTPNGDTTATNDAAAPASGASDISAGLSTELSHNSTDATSPAQGIQRTFSMDLGDVRE